MLEKKLVHENKKLQFKAYLIILANLPVAYVKEDAGCGSIYEIVMLDRSPFVQKEVIDFCEHWREQQ